MFFFRAYLTFLAHKKVTKNGPVLESLAKKPWPWRSNLKPFGLTPALVIFSAGHPLFDFSLR